MSRWFAYVRAYVCEANSYPQIWAYNLNNDKTTPLTTDRVDSYSPVWSPDGKWLYFLSDRHLESAVPSPWGARQPEPYFDKPVKVYQLSLLPEQRSPFQPADEFA